MTALQIIALTSKTTLFAGILFAPVVAQHVSTMTIGLLALAGVLAATLWDRVVAALCMMMVISVWSTQSSTTNL